MFTQRMFTQKGHIVKSKKIYLMHDHTVVRQSEGMPKQKKFLSTKYYFNQSQNNRPAKLLFDWLK